MYQYLEKLLEIAITEFKKIRKEDISETYKDILFKVKSKSLNRFDYEKIIDLYKNRFEQDSFTEEDKYNIEKELKELKKEVKLSC